MQFDLLSEKIMLSDVMFRLRKVRESNGFCGQASPAAILQQADLQRNYLTG